ncbi:hypothetical protein Q361_11718 [Flavobacterium croceum DSM 17960]|uniref:Uncharacterized protein n=1 Tax=Flavobacterium croceum DSM 17960 TaxID=1121886 RepID=A0A2S4N5E1_9FLAO|nr:hypothetical protein [Flavobacterium croceum]POS00915.1 hypothetical protein Q361_11718 [Flavobacterium croceum DSM 17960]
MEQSNDKTILEKAKQENQKLPKGFYSKVYLDPQTKERFRLCNVGGLHPVKNVKPVLSQAPKQAYVYHKGVGYLFDEELKMFIIVDKDAFFEATELELSLSNEQKELLYQGKDITLNAYDTKVYSQKNKLEIKTQKREIALVADFSFFLGKNSLSLLTPVAVDQLHKKQSNRTISHWENTNN